MSNVEPEDFFSPKYTREGKLRLLQTWLGETKLRQALTEVLIISYAINQRVPFLFTSNIEKEKSYRNRQNFCMVCEGFSMVDAAIATSAAPTFFKPFFNFTPTLGNYILIDGGVIANNPTSIAIIEVMNSYKIKTGKDISLDEILVVSIGTGKKPQKLTSKEMSEWGQIKWIDPLISMVFSGQSEVVDFQMEQLLTANKNNIQYYRFQPLYPEYIQDDTVVGFSKSLPVNDAMDAVDADNIKALQLTTEKFIEIETNKLTQLCESLIQAIKTREII